MNRNSFKISFFVQKNVQLQERRRIKSFISHKLQKAGKSGGEISYVFCSDKELLDINKTYLQHDYFTDIITFDLSEEGSKVLMSDIFISVDRVKENAVNQGTSVKLELLRVIFHGILHLIGFKDKTKLQSGEMRRMEDVWIAEFVRS